MDLNTSALIFLCIVGVGNALECYSCNVTGKHDNSCEGSLTTCTDPALCLSATYSSEDLISRQKQFATYKSCYLKTGLGLECDTFLKAIKVSNPQANFEFIEKCITCEENGCNQASAVNLSSFLIVVSLFCCIFNKVL